MSCLPKVRPCWSGIPVKPMSCDETFSLDGNHPGEKSLFDSFAQEHTGIIGTPMEYWIQNTAGSPFDALYGEPEPRLFKGPYLMKGFVVRPEEQPESREEGFRSFWRAEAWLARKEFEDKNIPDPHIGDIIRIWDIPYFNEQAPGESGFYFDIEYINNHGHMFDSPNFVGFSVQLKRRSDFVPERRIQQGQ